MIPDTQLTLSKIFEGKTIRAMELGGELWVPVVDIADAWEVDRSTLTKIITHNPDVFKKLSTVVDVTSPNQISPNPQTVNNSLRLVNERGMIILGLKVSASRIKNNAAKEKIIEFQLWVPELLQDLRNGLVQLAPSPQAPIPILQRPVDILKEHLDLADELVSRSGLTRERAHSYAVILAGERMGMELQCYATAIKATAPQQQLLLPEHLPQDKEDYDKHFSLTQISEFLKLPVNKVRNVLESLNLIYYENGIWHLTKQGEKYGKVFMITPSYPYRMNQKPYIKYNPLTLDILRKYFDVEVPVTKVKV